MNADYKYGLSQLAFMPNSPGRPSSLAETFNASLQQFNLAESGDAERNATNQARAEQRAIYEEITGGSMPEPLAALTTREGFGTDKEKYVITKFLEENPQYADRFNLDFEGRAAEISRQAEADYNEVMGRADGLTSFLGGLGGGVVGSITNPITLGVTAATLPLSWSYTGGRLLLTAAIEAGIAAATEIPLQTVAQEYRGRIGLESGFARGAENVLMAAAGAGALTSLFIGLGKGGKAVLERFAAREDISAADRSAAEQLLRHLAAEDEAPTVGADAADTALYRAQADEAYMSVLRAEPIRADVDPVLQRSELLSSTALTRRKAWSKEAARDVGNLLPEEVDAVFARITGAQDAIAVSRDTARAQRAADADVRMALEALDNAEAAQTQIRAQISRLDNAIESLEKGKLPREVEALADATDADTLARMRAVEQDLATPGLSKARRAELQREADMLAQSLPSEIIDRLAAKRAHIEKMASEADDAVALSVANYKSLDKVSRARKAAEQKAQRASLQRTQAQLNGDFDNAFPPSVEASQYRQTQIAAAQAEVANVQQRAKMTPQVTQSMAASLARIAEVSPEFRVSVEEIAPDGTTTFRQMTGDDIQKELKDAEDFLKAFEDCRRG